MGRSLLGGEVGMKSILVVQLKRLGDLILTTPALAALREEHPGCQVTVLIDHYSRDLAPALQHIDEVLVYERKRSFPIWLQLLRREFDLCIDCTGSDRSALISFLSKASHRIIFRSVARHRLRSWIYTELVDVSVRNCHTIDLYLSLVRPATAARNPAVELALPEATVSSAQKVKSKLGVTGPFFVVHPGTARREKYWVPERWAEVLHHLNERLHLPAVITGGSDPEESKHIEAIKGFLGPDFPVANVAGRVDFLLTAALIREAAFFVGVDTAAKDAERTRAVCKVLGSGMIISADANQGFSTADAIEYVRAVKGAGLDFFEQRSGNRDTGRFAAVERLPQRQANFAEIAVDL